MMLMMIQYAIYTLSSVILKMPLIVIIVLLSATYKLASCQCVHPDDCTLIVTESEYYVQCTLEDDLRNSYTCYIFNKFNTSTNVYLQLSTGYKNISYCQKLLYDTNIEVFWNYQNVTLMVSTKCHKPAPDNIKVRDSKGLVKCHNYYSCSSLDSHDAA